ncbi:MAG: TPR end-of-group domain-containing protein [Chthoniobacterales bacterium]
MDAIPAEGIKDFPNDYPRASFAGLVARTFGDHDAARVSFSAARAEVEKLVLAQPDNATTWSLLGRIDAALGRREDALREGRRACELMPVSKNATGVFFVTDLAVVYAWLGENDLALEQLAISARLPAGVYYGGLKLDPQWDPLRGDPRFEKIVASLAPQP